MVCPLFPYFPFAEGLRLRVKDLEFEYREIILRESEGNKDRATVLPENLILPLEAHSEKVRACMHVIWSRFRRRPLAGRAGKKYPKAVRLIPAWVSFVHFHLPHPLKKTYCSRSCGIQ